MPADFLRLKRLLEKLHASLTGVTSDQHHARQHALDAAADHTGSITDAQHGVRTQANAHAHGHLSGVTADQHHAQSHTLGSHSTKAHAELTGVGANDHHAKYTDAEALAAAEAGGVSAATANKLAKRDASARAKFAAPSAVGDALIKGTRITTAELPALTNNKLWKGTGANPTEIDVPSAGEGHILILPFNYQSIGQGTWAIGIDTSQLSCGFFHNSSSNDGDNISYNVYLAAGTYTLRILTIKGTYLGILDIDIDATEVASFDLYSASPTYNAVSTQASIAVATAGLKSLRLRVDGKNGSSSDYSVLLSVIGLWRTA